MIPKFPIMLFSNHPKCCYWFLPIIP